MKVIFSPHNDDAFLSLAGLMLKWRKKESVRVIDLFTRTAYTIFTGRQIKDPNNPKEGKLIEMITYLRKLEETAAAKTIGVELSFSDYNDAPLRGHYDYSLISKVLWRIYNRPRKPIINEKVEEELAKNIRGIISDHSEDDCYFPLGIGGHVDHMMVARAAANHYHENGSQPVTFYEDQPYTAYETEEDADVIAKTVERLGLGLKPKTMSIDWQAKSKLLTLYGSQIKPRHIDHLGAYCANLGGERIWSTT